MTTRFVTSKIPAKHNVHAQDVTGIMPSTVGKAWAAGVAKRSANAGSSRRSLKVQRIADAALKVVHGLDAIIKIRDSAEAASDPELAALANDPKLMDAIAKFIGRLGKAADSLIREAKAEREAVQTARRTPETGLDAASHSVASKLPGFDAKLYNSMGADDKGLYEFAVIKASGIPRVQFGDTFENQARVEAGLAPIPLSGDDLYAHFEGKK